MLAIPARWAASMSVKESPTRAVAAGSASRPRTACVDQVRAGLEQGGVVAGAGDDQADAVAEAVAV